MNRAARCLLLIMSVTGVAWPRFVSSADGSTSEVVLAPGYEPLEFEPPRPGSYELPMIREAPDGSLLSSTGDRVTLHELMTGKLTVLGFIYLSCGDVNGCPLALYVMRALEKKLQEEHPGMLAQVRLISLSFDPARDTPTALARHKAHMVGPDSDWWFLTGTSRESLQPVLEAYGQSVVTEVDGNGDPTGQLSHVLRVFLVDPELKIRNIYSTSFLHAQTLINDILTVARERGPAIDPPREMPRLHEPGDDRSGYHADSYRSRTVSLERRQGENADLMAIVESPPLGLPPVPAPEGNAPTREKVKLGRRLFYDRRLSHNGTISCAMCHVPEQGFGSSEMATAVGMQGRSVRRNAPTLYNVAYHRALFHDGRETSLEQQIWGPLLAHNEMGNPSVGVVLDRIRTLAEYPPLFEAAFGRRGISMETVGMALASYQRTLISGASAFDRWYYGADPAALSASARHGFELFTGEAHCATCHLVGEDHALFTDDRFHNTGIGYRAAFDSETVVSEMIAAPGEVIELAPGVAEHRKPNDLGRYEVTLQPQDRWKYRTPTLRNVALTGPYMHDGSLRTLGEVLRYYRSGGHANEGLSPHIRTLDLSEDDMKDLESFLHALTGSNVPLLVADAYAAPVGD